MRKGFTFIELVFVIVVMAILAGFGVNILRTIYDSYKSSTDNNKLQFDTELAVKQLANRLQYRIKDSAIARVAALGAFDSLSSIAPLTNYTILEWIGVDIDGFHGTNRVGLAGEPIFNRPAWSGFIDVDNVPAGVAFLESPGTDTGDVNAIIQNLRPTGSGTTIANAAIFFTGANADVQNDFGWDGIAEGTQNNTAAHRITDVGSANVTELVDSLGVSFAGADIYEQYKLSWTAYGVRIEDFDGDGDNDLVLYHDYQPWEGETIPIPPAVTTGRNLLLENISTFKFTAIGDVVRIQVCVDEQDALARGDGGYSICKEAAIF